MFSANIERRPQPGMIFPGWGPKLLGIALAASTIEFTGTHALAATVSLKSTCAVSDSPARAVSIAIPEYPAMAALQGLEGMSVVSIHLSADGTLTNASIAQRAVHPSFDREALRTVRNTRFSPATVDCQPVEGDYLYRIEFRDSGAPSVEL